MRAVGNGGGRIVGGLEAASAGDHRDSSMKDRWTKWSGRCMIRAIMKLSVSDVVRQGSHSGVPGVGVPCIGIREGGIDREAFLYYSPKK